MKTTRELTLRLKDPAFLDRVDIKTHVPPPDTVACFEILRRGLLELPPYRLTLPERPDLRPAMSNPLFASSGYAVTLEDFLVGTIPPPVYRLDGIPADRAALLRSELAGLLPDYTAVLLQFGHLPDHPAMILLEIARDCAVRRRSPDVTHDGG